MLTKVRGLPEHDPVATVAAGHHHTLCVTKSGDVWAFGRNDASQCGLGKDAPPSIGFPAWVEALSDPREEHGRVISVAAGQSHSLACTESGGVYAWGAAIFGALGLGEDVNEEVLRPQAVRLPPAHAGSEEPSAAVAVSCGVHHSLALTEAGAVLAWGWGRHGQLGDGSEGGHAFTPRVVHGLDVERVACSGRRACARLAPSDRCVALALF